MKISNLLIIIVISVLSIANSLFAQWVHTYGPFAEYRGTAQVVASGNNIFAATSLGVFRWDGVEEKWSYVNTGIYKWDKKKIFASGKYVLEESAWKFGYYNAYGLSNDYGTNWLYADPIRKFLWYYEISVNDFITKTNIHGGINLFIATENGVFVSADSGNTWAAVDSDLTNQNVTVLFVNQENILAGTYKGLFISSNNGKSWNPMDSIFSNLNIYSIFKTDSNLFVSTSSGVFRSSDEGKSWISTNFGLAGIVYSFASIDTTLFAGTNRGVFSSTDYGTNWTKVSSGLTDSTVYSLAVLGSEIFAGTPQGGTYLSTNLGKDWVDIDEGLNNTTEYLSISKLEFSESGNYIFAGTADGIFISNNKGTSWTKPESGISNYDVRGLTVDGSNIIACTFHSGVFLSENNGKRWKSIGLNGHYITGDCLVKGNDIFVGTSDGVFVTSDSGKTWNKDNFGMTDSVIVSLVYSDSNIFAGTNSQGVFLSANNGSNWVQVNSGLTGSEINFLASNANKVYAGVSSKGLFIFNNANKSWEPINNGLTNFNVTFNITSMAFRDSIMFLGTGGRIFTSLNNGNSWTFVNPDSSNSNINSICVNDSDLYIGTSNGVWFRPLKGVITGLQRIKKDMPMNFALEQNYPNPFNPTTTISYSIPKTCFVNIEVYDILGDKIANLVNGEKTEGNYEIQFNANKFSSGIYFYELKASNYTSVKKMILLK